MTAVRGCHKASHPNILRPSAHNLVQGFRVSEVRIMANNNMAVVFHHGAFGDWVLAFPVLRAIGGKVAVVTAWSKAQLAARVFDHVEPIDAEQTDFSRLFVDGGWREVSAATRQRLSQADTVISFVSDGRDAWADNVRRLAESARCFFVSPRPPTDWPGHVCDWHKVQLEEQGYEPASVGQDVQRHANATGPVVVHPGSGGKHKCWASERFERLIQLLLDRGYAVRTVAGEVEQDTWPDEVLDRWTQRYDLTVCDSPLDLHTLLLGARGYVGNDSGPTHLAAAMGLPTVALFGPTPPAHWSPRGAAVTVVAPAEPKAMDWLTVECAADAVLAGIAACG